MNGLLVGRNSDGTFWIERWSMGRRDAVLAAYFSLDEAVQRLWEAGLTVYFDASVGEREKEVISQRLAAYE